MTEVINVRFRNRGKSYFFDPQGVTVPEGSRVVVETQKGLELGECAHGNHFVNDENVVSPLRPVLRLATEEDLRAEEQNRSREREAYAVCQKKIAERGLDMKLVKVESSLDGGKILFFFTSDGRVDFRDLVKDLASTFHTRIELRQIGVRDEAKMLGGLGVCGRPFCCSQFLDDFHPVSTKMAKVQSMSLNPTKISGSCGRLMCCLRYEQDAYEDLVKKVPKLGSFVETPEGFGSVAQSNVLRQTVKVKLDSAGEPVIKVYGVDEIAVVPGGRSKTGELPASVLPPRPRAQEDGTPASRETPVVAPVRPMRQNRPAAGGAAPKKPQAKRPKSPGAPRLRTQDQGQNQAAPAPSPAQGNVSQRRADEGGKQNRRKRRYYK